MSGVIKLTNEDMLRIATTGRSLCDDYANKTRQLVAVANELAIHHMRGAAGTAVLNKTTELQATVDRMTQMAQEKYQGIGQFAQAGLNSTQEANSRIMAIAAA
jgi:hypothetical protein